MNSRCIVFKARNILRVVGILLLGSSLFAQSDSASGSQVPAGSAATTNPNQIAILRWYRANSAATFAVGQSPGQAAFDGSNIWVTNSNANTVTKLRASDGASLGEFPAGTSPSGIAFDGASMWIANQDNSSVTKLRASDGKILGTFPG